MPHHTPLIATIVAGLVAAFALGALAQRLRLSPLVGYLLAGVIVGPFTPGYVADQKIANELAEIGVILLMFGVGLHFSVKDLMAVRKIAVPGALAQMAVATILGIALSALLGWPLISGLVFGLALSVASTVVLLRALQERRLVQTERGKIAVGWLIVEDLAMVLALVLLPALAGAMKAGEGAADPLTAWGVPLGLTLLKVGGFVAFMLVVARRAVPWLLHYVAHTGSRELFRLAVFAIALGVAFGAATLFGVSFALGAFFAGMILADSELSHRAAEETLPLRDAFAVLFFVSVGMLFNPFVVLANPLTVLAVLAIVIIGKSLAAYAILKLFKRSDTTAITVAASLAQIGEFSFILAGLGVDLQILPREGRDLILAGAIISIMLNPLIFAVALRTPKTAPVEPAAPLPAAPEPEPANDLSPTALSGHIVVVGYGRVGQAVSAGLKSQGKPFVLVEAEPEFAAKAAAEGYEVIIGSAVEPRVLEAAGVPRAARMYVAVTDGFECGGVVDHARKANALLEIIARAHTDAEAAHLIAHGADRVVMGEAEIARGMLEDESPAAEPAGEVVEFAAGAPRLLILDDAERAVLAAVRSFDIWPGEAISWAAVHEAAVLRGNNPERLEHAWETLRAKDCLRDLDEDRVTLTKQGFLAALQPAAA
ncbi:YbaL family putative K(+) efflux transporter [Phenylobacterium sp. NIBR 498073]|uniref:YbaL family putative K(+) efflux transporter n=1 Tax=Phenylobacterium sp. NIBR 498073 TaxID=3015177 RepID=UPI0022B49889|nr:YbaL family putative K(+) efflux transporter [Phenylobacterium sp. NIBR 498073]WGU38793.1 YbaL family putative K(+) efflux transporter [Phenylobacterium sp. NIBR 498073]